MISVKIIIGLGITALIFLFAYKRKMRKQYFRGREPMSLEKIYNSYIKKYGIKYETFEKVYRKLGDSYSIDSQLIRPSDPMKMFFNIDSWDLDAGTEKIEEWLEKTLKMDVPKKEIKTVLDFLIYVEKGTEGIL